MLLEWQSGLLDRHAPYTVLNCRKVCRQAFIEAVKLDLIQEGSEDLQIQAFIDDVRDMEPGAEVVDDQDADGDTDGRRIGFYRR